jgi:hypothetical protein
MLLVGIIFGLILSTIATAATIKVLLSGKVFETPRNYIFSRVSETSFLGKLIRCPYCLSFWFSAFILLGMFLFPKTWLAYCLWLTVQRMSNVFDDWTDRIYYGQYGSSGLNFDQNQNKDS